MPILLAALAVAARFSVESSIWKGITIDSCYEADAVVASLSGLKSRPITRVVLDPGTSPKDYSAAVAKMHTVSDIMGSAVDSAPPNGNLTVEAYRARMSEFMDGLGKDVDVWEIGNEVNGDWTGDSATMGAKIQAGFEEAKARKRPTALTLFYSDYYQGKDREMSAWAMQYLSAAVRNGVDYVLVSFYTDTATGPQPDWEKQFAALGRVFPKAKLGFGELGLRKADFTLSDDEAGKAALIRRYYNMPSPCAKRFIGGYFWWTFRQDAVPKSKPLWSVFQEVIR